MGIVNRYARGLLSLLDSQTQGDTPSSMGDVIAPTMDINELMYASRGLEITAATTTQPPVTLSVAGIVTVPAGEMWLVRRVVSRILNNDAAVAMSIRFVPVVQFGTTSIPVSLLEGSFGIRQTINATQIYSVGSQQQYPMILNQGAIIQTMIEDAAAYAGVDPTVHTLVHHHRLFV